MLQPVPLFFVVGGWAAARSLDAATPRSASEWVSTRLARLLGPAGTFALVALAIAALLAAIAPDGDRAAARLLGMPLWFLAVYVPITALSPLLHRAVLRRGWRVPRDAAIGMLLVDLSRFVGDVPGIGWANFGCVWLLFTTLGMAAHRDAPRTRAAVVVGGVAIVMLATVVALDWYPVSMVGVGRRSNNTPPTVALGLLGVAQAAIACLAAPAVRRLIARRRRVARATSVVGAFGMHLYLWHLCATLGMVAIMRTGLGNLEPLGAQWWATRPLWLGALTLGAIPIVMGAARYDLGRIGRASSRPVGNPVRVGVATVVATMALTALALRGFELGPVAVLAVAGVHVAASTARARRAPDVEVAVIGGNPAWSSGDSAPKVNT